MMIILSMRVEIVGGTLGLFNNTRIMLTLRGIWMFQRAKMNPNDGYTCWAFG